MRQRVAGARRKYRGAVRRNPSIRRPARVARTSVRRRRLQDPARQPTHPHEPPPAPRLLSFNEKLLAKCKTNSDPDGGQRARGNNDRVVIMPGLLHRAAVAQVPDQRPEVPRPAAAERRAVERRRCPTPTRSTCPNDQNLIALHGRAGSGPGRTRQPPRWDRRGIPTWARCIRCNVQIEGSGAKPDDVIIDAGAYPVGQRGPESRRGQGRRHPRRPRRRLRARQRQDARTRKEHNIYVLESDGYLLDRFKTYYAGEYGVLTFVSDHGVIAELRRRRPRRLGLVPRRRARRPARRPAKAPAPTTRRSTAATCRHSASGYSGTAANGVWHAPQQLLRQHARLHHRRLHRLGPPGLPQDSDLVENNNFYSNNFNLYVAGSDVEPDRPGAGRHGAWIAGGNNNVVRHNHFWDNWRRGAMLFAVPDAVVCGPGAGGNEQNGLRRRQDLDLLPQQVRHQHHGPHPGQARATPTASTSAGTASSNNTNNCWYEQHRQERKRGQRHQHPGLSAGARPATASRTNCATSRGLRRPAARSRELLGCFADFTAGNRSKLPVVQDARRASVARRLGLALAATVVVTAGCSSDSNAQRRVPGLGRRAHRHPGAAGRLPATGSGPPFASASAPCVSCAWIARPPRRQGKEAHAAAPSKTTRPVSSSTAPASSTTRAGSSCTSSTSRAARVPPQHLPAASELVATASRELEVGRAAGAGSSAGRGRPPSPRGPCRAAPGTPPASPARATGSCTSCFSPRSTRLSRLSESPGDSRRAPWLVAVATISRGLGRRLREGHHDLAAAL